MSIDISPADTGDITRPVGEKTQAIQLDDLAVIPRRPHAEPPTEDFTQEAERAFSYVRGSTGELPIVIAAEDRQAVIAAVTEPVSMLPVVEPEPQNYVGRHRPGTVVRRATDAPTTFWSRLIGRPLGHKAGAL